MARIVGLGGVFVKLADHDAWRNWYRNVLGLGVDDWGSLAFPGPDQGSAVISAFAIDSDYFDPSQAPFMISLVVEDIDGVLRNVQAAGVQPLGREDNENGRFAWLLDPVGMKVELWEPPA